MSDYPISPPIARAAPPRLPDTLDFDLACRRCSYNLRGLLVSQRCPECGTPVGLSAKGDLLRFADPEWLRKLAKGLSYVLWGMLVTFVFGMFVGIAALAGLPPFVAGLIVFGGSLLQCYGVYVFTEPDPSGLNEESYFNLRRLIRIWVAVSLVGGLLNTVFSLEKLPPAWAVPLMIFTVLLQMIGLIGEWARLRYLQLLAERIPAPQLSARAEWLAWAYPGSMAFVLAMSGAMAIIGIFSGAAVGPPPAAGPGAAPAPGVVPAAAPAAVGIFAGLGCAMMLGSLILLILIFYWIRLQYRMQKAIAAEAEAAEQVWRSAAVT